MPENSRPKIYSRVVGLKAVKSIHSVEPEPAEKYKSRAKAVVQYTSVIPGLSNAGVLSAFMLSTLPYICCKVEWFLDLIQTSILNFSLHISKLVERDLAQRWRTKIKKYSKLPPRRKSRKERRARRTRTSHPFRKPSQQYSLQQQQSSRARRRWGAWRALRGPFVLGPFSHPCSCTPSITLSSPPSSLPLSATWVTSRSCHGLQWPFNWHLSPSI